MDHSKWAVTIPDSSKLVTASRKLLQNATSASAAEDLSKVCDADRTLQPPIPRTCVAIECLPVSTHTPSVLPGTSAALAMYHGRLRAYVATMHREGCAVRGCSEACVSADVAAHAQVFCMADINRAGSQAVRGGGALCFTSNAGVWQAFYNTIAQEEQCDKSSQ